MTLCPDNYIFCLWLGKIEAVRICKAIIIDKIQVREYNTVMNNIGNESINQVLTYDLTTCAHVAALQFAYNEVGKLREVKTPQQQKLYDSLARISIDEDDGIIGTVEDMFETADLLREWGAANMLPSGGATPQIPVPRKESYRADAPAYRTVVARLALTMAEDISAMAFSTQEINIKFDPQDFYNFFDGQQAS